MDIEKWLDAVSGHETLAPVPGFLKSGIRAISNACVGRRFCITSSGQPCLAPTTVQSGDLICLVKAARVPFVIRPVKEQVDRFVLVGEAYVHGIMYGEGLKGIKWGNMTLVRDPSRYIESCDKQDPSYLACRSLPPTRTSKLLASSSNSASPH
jgi:hypothetical protein